MSSAAVAEGRVNENTTNNSGCSVCIAAVYATMADLGEPDLSIPILSRLIGPSIMAYQL